MAANMMPSAEFMTADGILKIEACKWLASGERRHVHVHPEKPGMLIKVIRADHVDRGCRTRRKDQERDGRGPFVPYWRMFGPYATFFREMKESLRAAHLVHPARTFDFPFSRVCGFIWTTRGLGEMVERIASADGSLAPTLRNLVKEKRFTPEHARRLDEFFELCGKTGLILSALNAQNIVYQDDDERFVCVSGFGERNVIAVHEWSRLANRTSLRRTRRRLLRTIRELSAIAP